MEKIDCPECIHYHSKEQNGVFNGYADVKRYCLHPEIESGKKSISYDEFPNPPWCPGGETKEKLSSEESKRIFGKTPEELKEDNGIKIVDMRKMGKSPGELNSNEGGKEMTEKRGNLTGAPGIPTPNPSIPEPKREETISEKLEDVHAQTVDLCQISYSIAAKVLGEKEEKPLIDDASRDSIQEKTEVIRDNIRMVKEVLTKIDQRL